MMQLSGDHQRPELGEGDGVRQDGQLAKILAWAVAVLPAWICFVSLENAIPRLGFRAWDMQQTVASFWFLVSSITWVFAPFGRAMALGYDWMSPLLPAATILLFMTLPAVCTALFAWLRRDWRLQTLIAFGSVGAAWVVVSIAANPGMQGLFAPLIDPRIPWVGTLQHVGVRILIAGPFLAWIMLICPWIVASLAGARARTTKDNHERPFRPTQDGAAD